MLSLGYKERVVLDGSEFTFGSVLTTTNAISTVTGDVKVKGLGTIPTADVTAVRAARAYPQIFEIATFTMPALDTGKTYTISVQIETFRYQANLATDFIHFKRPIVIQLVGSGTASTDAAALVSIFNSLFGDTSRHTGRAPYTMSASSATVTLTSLTLGLKFKKVTQQKTYPNAEADMWPSNITLSVSPHGDEGRNTGKQLEEDHHMATPHNTNPFKTASDQIFNLKHGYTELQVTTSHAEERDISTVAAGAKFNREQKFVVYVDEGQEPGGAITNAALSSTGGDAGGATYTNYNPESLHRAIVCLAYWADGKNGTLVGPSDPDSSGDVTPANFIIAKA